MNWWCIFYGDESTFSNEDGSPFDAPRTDVQAIVKDDDWVGYQIVHANDYYCLDLAHDGWYCTDLIGMADYLIRTEQPLVLFGRMTTNKEYLALLDNIRKKYGDKQGYLQTEVRRRGT